MLKSPFRFPGGKSKKSIRQRILKYAPKIYKEARFPFVGGGGIFFAIDPNIKRWINDIDMDLMSVYIALKERSQEFIEECKKIEPQKLSEKLTSTKKGGKKIYNARLKKVFDQFVKDKNMDPALRYYFLNRVVWYGRVNYDLPSRLYYSNPQGWNIIKKDVLEKAAEFLKNTHITIGPYEKLLQQKGDSVFIFADPPYLKNTNLQRSSQLYKYGFTLEQHKKFAEDVQKCKHKVLITYDDNPLIRQMYPSSEGFTIIEENWTYCGTSKSKKEKGKELIIINY